MPLMLEKLKLTIEAKKFSLLPEAEFFNTIGRLRKYETQNQRGFLFLGMSHFGCSETIATLESIRESLINSKTQCRVRYAHRK